MTAGSVHLRDLSAERLRFGQKGLQCGSECEISALAILPECFPKLAAVVLGAVAVGHVDHPMCRGERCGWDDDAALVPRFRRHFSRLF